MDNDESMNKTSLPTVVDHRAASEMMREAREPNLDAIDRNSTGALVRLAMERNLDITVLEKLLALKREEEAEQARRAFVAAFAAFHTEAPTIIKDKLVGYETRPKDGSKGEKVGYSHATIGNVIETAGPVLGRYGFGWGWTPVQQDKGGLITVSCRLTHELGHFEEAAISAGPDSSGKKNPIQQVASTITYLQRYTFLLVTGLATRDQQDDDGKAGGRPASAHSSDLPGKAADTIAAFTKALGDRARGDLERWVECEAPQWGADQYRGLRDLWVLLFGDAKKGIEPRLDETMAKIEAMRAEVASAGGQ